MKLKIPKHKFHDRILHPHLPILVLVLTGLIHNPAYSQEDNGTPGTDEPVFELNPFVVSGDGAESYLTTSTISATRINVALQDLPMQIGILSEAFIRDTAAFDLSEAITYLPAVEELEELGGSLFFIRGFRSDTAMRDGVRTFTVPSSAVIERIELVKGPAALMFGQTSPGGVLNYVTRKPLWKKQLKIDTSVGSYDFYRGAISYNGVLNKDAAFLITAEYIDKGSIWHLAGKTDKEFSLAPILQWRPTDKTIVDFSVEYFQYDRINSRRHFAEDPRFEERTPGTALFPKYYVGDPPNFWREEESITPSIQVVHHFTDWLTLRLNSVYVKRKNDYTRTGNSPVDSPLGNQDATAAGFGLNQTLAFLDALRTDRYPGISDDELINTPEANGFRFPHFMGERRENERKNIQLDFLLNFSTWIFDHKMLLGAEILREERTQVVRNLMDIEKSGLAPDGTDPNDTYNPRSGPFAINFSGELVFNREYTIGSMTFKGWNVPLQGNSVALDLADFWVDELNKGNAVWADLSNQYRESKADAFYMSDQISFNEGKGRIMLGLRYDKLYSLSRDLQVPVIESDAEFSENQRRGWAGESDSGTTEWSPMMGTSYRILDGVNFFAVYSESVDPQGTPANATVEEPFPAIEGLGEEAGFKFLLFDNRLSLTMSAFKIIRANIALVDARDIDPSDGQDYLFIGEQESKGYDVELYLNPMRGMEIKTAYTFTDSEVLGISSDNTALVGVGDPLPNTRKHMANFWMSYNFQDGPLEGFGIGGGVKYGSTLLKSPRGYPLPSYLVGDLAFFYDWEMYDGNWRAQLNIKNVNDEEYIHPSRIYNDPTEWIFSISAKF